MNIYEENGYDNRSSNLLGPYEDFDGLVRALEDCCEDFNEGEQYDKP